MPDTPIKLTLEADWGTSETKKGDKKLHGRIYRIKAGQYMFVSAAYDGSKIKFRAWPCTRAGKHEHNPMFVGTDMTIGRFLARFGYINEESGRKQREARLIDTMDDTTADGSPLKVATYHVFPPMGGQHRTSTVTVTTRPVGRSNIRTVRVDYPDGTHDVSESIGWDTDAQALGKLGITVVDSNEPDWHTTARDLLTQAMRRNHDDGGIIQLGGGNWDALLDVRCDRPDLTAWSEQWVYTYTVNSHGVGEFTPAPRNPRLPRHAHRDRTSMIRALFIEGASGTYTRMDAETLFDQWLSDEHEGMGTPLALTEAADA